MSGLFGLRSRSRPDGECATHGSYPGELDGCLKCGAGSVAPAPGPVVVRSAAAASSWLERQAAVLEMAARLDPAAVHAARMAAQARAMAALTERAHDLSVTDASGAVFEPVGAARAGDAGADDGSENGWEAGF